MAETPQTFTEPHLPGTSDSIDVREKDKTAEEEDDRMSKMTLVRKEDILSNASQLVKTARESALLRDQLDELKVQLGREEEHLAATKRQLYGYRKLVIEHEKKQLPELSTEQLEWALNRNRRKLLSLMRQLRRDETDLKTGNMERPVQQHLEDRLQKGQHQRNEEIVALKKLMGGLGRLADELSSYVQKEDNELIELYSLAHKHVIAFHLEQVLWHQKMVVWNLQELSQDIAWATKQEELEVLLKDFFDVVGAQEELVNMLEDRLYEQRPERQEKGSEVQEIGSKMKGDREEVNELILRETHLVKECPLHSCSGGLKYIDLLMEECFCINVRWEVTFAHRGAMEDKGLSLQIPLVENIAMLRQQVFSLAEAHAGFFNMTPELVTDLDQQILLQQGKYWDEILKQRKRAVFEKTEKHQPHREVEPQMPLVVEAQASTSGVWNELKQTYVSSPDVSLTEGRDVKIPETETKASTSTDGGGSADPMTTQNTEELFQDNPSTSSSHLQKILDEHEKLTASFSEIERSESIFQLSYIAISYFNERGGSLALEEYKVHLYIPRGAIPKDCLQKVYIYVNPDAPPVDGIDPPNVALSPVIQCGPPGLTFLDSVVVSFPHHAKENSNWKLNAMICINDDSESNTWQGLDAENDGILVSTHGNRVVLLLNHFTGVALVGNSSQSSTKVVKIGTFGGVFHQFQTGCTVRIHVWNDDTAAEKKVMRMEKKLDCKLLDAYRYLEVYYEQGDVKVEIDHIKDGWEMEADSLQIISKSRIWRFPVNSLTFELSRSAVNLPDALPRCNGFIYQLSSEASVAWNGDRVVLSVKPKQVERSRPGEAQTYSTRDHGRSQLITNSRDRFNMKIRENMYGDYGGLPVEVIDSVCGSLEERESVDNLIEHLLGVSDSLTETARQKLTSHVRGVLKIYFAFCREKHISDEAAVEDLLELCPSERPGEDWTASEFQNMRRVQGILSMDKAPQKRPSSWDDIFSPEIANERSFRDLAKLLGPEWEEIATYLGYTSAEIGKIKMGTPVVNNQIFEMLVGWKRKCGSNDDSATSVLAGCLEKVGRSDLADQLLGKKKMYIPGANHSMLDRNSNSLTPSAAQDDTE